jgi:tetratricopeptide (TPR) repeat protein
VFWVGAIVELTGRPLAEIRETLGRLRVKELVVPHDPSSFRDEQEFAFRHALIRDGAYDSLPKALRADMHLGVARWAEARAGDRADEIAELLATHEVEAIRYLDELGERRPEIERTAFAASWAAARRTKALQLNGEGTRWYREAERLADRLDVPLQDRARLAREHAALSRGADTAVETERVVRRAISILEQLDDQQGVGWGISRLVIPLMQQSRHDEAEQAGRDAVAKLEPLGESADLADAMHRLAWFLWRRGAVEEAEPLLRRAVALAETFDAPLSHAEATQTLAVTLAAMGKFTESHMLMEQAFNLAKDVGDPENLFRAYNNWGFTMQATRGPAATVEVMREGLDLALRSGVMMNAGWIAGTIGDLLDVLGRLREAEDMHRQAVELATRLGDAPLLGQRLSALAAVLIQRGKIDEAVEFRDMSAPVLAANPEPQSNHFLPWVDGHVAMARGDLVESAKHLTNAADFVVAQSVEGAPETPLAAVRALRRIDDMEGARRYADIDRLRASLQGAPHAQTISGLLEPDPRAAVTALRGAIEEYERLGMMVFAARAMVDLGSALAHAAEDASQVLRRAREILVEHDAQLFLSEVDEAEARVRGQAAKTAPAGPIGS